MACLMIIEVESILKCDIRYEMLQVQSNWDSICAFQQTQEGRCRLVDSAVTRNNISSKPDISSMFRSAKVLREMLADSVALVEFRKSE